MTGGVFGEVFSITRPAFLVGKLILGIGLGFYLTVAPLYASELAPIALRGIVTAGVNFAIVIGQLLSNAVIKGFGDRTDRWAYVYRRVKGFLVSKTITRVLDARASLPPALST